MAVRQHQHFWLVLAALASISLVAPTYAKNIPLVGGYTPPRKFVIVSNAMKGTIEYGILPDSGKIENMRTLVSASDGLYHPQGLAVDQKRRLLLVADSGLKKVVSYGLMNTADGLAVDQQTPVVEGVEVRWVAVDGLGNVFFSDEVNHQLMKVTAQEADDGNSSGTALFSGTSVMAPGGVATDNYFLFWTNKVDGDTKGSVGRVFQDGPYDVNGQPQGFLQVANNTPKSYGVCVAGMQLFYTDAVSTVWGVGKHGGTPVAVSKALSYPRGCAWDGKRVLVADRGAGAVFAFDAPMNIMGETNLERVADVEEAFGIAVFSAAAAKAACLPLLMTCVALILVLRG